jgi:transketolase
MPGAQPGSRGKAAHEAWTKTLGTKDAGARAEFEPPHERRSSGQGACEAVAKMKAALAAAPKEIATRTASNTRLKFSPQPFRK